MPDGSIHDMRAHRIEDRARAAYHGAKARRKALDGGGLSPITLYLRVWSDEARRDVFRSLIRSPLFPWSTANRAAVRGGRAPLWRPRRAVPIRIGVPGAFGLSRAARLTLAAVCVGTAAVATHVVMPNITETAAQAALRSLPAHGADWAVGKRTQLACVTLQEVRDANDALVGWLPPRIRCTSPDLPRPQFRTAAMPQNQAARLARMIAVVEGGHRQGRDTLLGINLLGLARASRSVVQSLCCDANFVGGSNGILTGLKNVNGEPGATSVRRRIAYLWETARLTAEILPDDAARDLWVAMTLPAAQGASGSAFGAPVAGGLLSSVVFGKDRMADLSDAELCILAAALKRNIQITSARSPADAQAAAQARNEQVRVRALARCVAPLEASGEIASAVAEAMRTEIRSKAFPVGAESTTVNPDLALASHLPGARRLVQDALSLVPASASASGSDPVRLTLRHEAQAHLESEMDRLLPDLRRVLAPQLCFSGCADADRVDLLAVAVELQEMGRDRIVAAWQSRNQLLTGPLVSAPDGTRRRGTPTRSPGSLPKLLALPRLSEILAATVCRRQWADLHDVDGSSGSDCSNPDHFMDLATMLARSSNLAYAEAMRLRGTEAVRDWFTSLGFTIRPRDGLANLRRSLATGENAVASPETLVRALAAIARGATGEAPLAHRPTLLRDAPEPEAALDLSQLGIDVTDLSRLGPTLGAPIRRTVGTLHSLAAPLETLGCQTESIFGKSGSSDAADPAGRGVRDKLVLFHADCQGHRFVVFAMIGSPRVDQSVGQVSTALTGRLALAALEAALTPNQP